MATDASPGRRGSVGFFGRALAGKGGKDAGRGSSFLAGQWHAGLGEALSRGQAKEANGRRRLVSTAPLPPSLAPRSPPVATSNDSSSASSPTTRRSSHSNSTSPPCATPLAQRTREASNSSAISSVSTTNSTLSPSDTVQRRLSSSSIAERRPTSSAFPSRRPSADSSVSSRGILDDQPAQHPSLRKRRSAMALSGRTTPEAHGGRTLALPSLATPKVGSSQMEAFVDALRKSDGRGERTGRPRSPDHAGDASGWNLGGRGEPSMTSPDASTRPSVDLFSPSPVDLFAAGPTSSLSANDDISAFERAKRRLDQSGAPDAVRQDSLRAVERRPWMVVQPDGSVRTDLEIVEAYREKVAGGRGKSGILPISAETQASRPRSPTPSATTEDATSTAPPTVPPKSPPRPLKLSPPRQREPSPTNRRASLPYVPFPASPVAATSADSFARAKTIEEIIAEHAPASYLEKRKSLAVPPSPSSHTDAAGDKSARALARTDSVDSLAAEIEAAGLAHAVLVDAEAQGDKKTSSRQLANGLHGSECSRGEGFQSNGRSPTPASTASTADRPYSPRATSPKPLLESEALATERELARLLKSPRLTRIFTLRRPPNAGLSVSVADVGDPAGHPVLVFLGLGAVRYLVALYDEIAEALGLRLLCFDRWGLGKTSEIPNSRRGFVEWAPVVAELASSDHLDLSTFSILAHSAGAPYAVASSLHSSLSPKVHGSLHLLAPWVSSTADSLAGAYKYLKYVPSSVLKTAQAAEWKVQGWRLGAPPALVHSPVGYDAKSGRMVDGFEGEDGDGAAVSPLQSPSLLNADRQLATKRGSKGVLNGLGGLFGGSDRGSPSRASTPDSPSSERRSSLRPASFFVRRASDLGASPTSPTTIGLAPPSPSTPVRRHSFLASPSSTLSPPATPLRPHSPSSSSLRPDSSRSPIPATFTSSSNPSLASPSVSQTTPSSAFCDTSRPNIPPAALIDGLLRASHAESLRGGTSDLLVLLERTSPSSSTSSSSLSTRNKLGFSYADVPHGVKVWFGDKDDRISLSSVRWLETEVNGGAAVREGKRCEVRIVEGAGHGLMTNSKVMLDVLESIAAEARFTR